MDIKEFLAELDERTKDNHGSERALFNLLTAFEDRVSYVLDGDFSTNAHGEWFHKAFRQVDVTENSYIDMAIWHLLHESTIVWDIIDEEYKRLEAAKAPMKYDDLDAKTLAAAFHILHGPLVKADWPDGALAKEMKSIFSNNSQPCVPFTNWLACIAFLDSSLENYNLNRDNDI